MLEMFCEADQKMQERQANTQAGEEQMGPKTSGSEGSDLSTYIPHRTHTTFLPSWGKTLIFNRDSDLRLGTRNVVPKTLTETQQPCHKATKSNPLHYGVTFTEQHLWNTDREWASRNLLPLSHCPPSTATSRTLVLFYVGYKRKVGEEDDGLNTASYSSRWSNKCSFPLCRHQSSCKFCPKLVKLFQHM